MEVADYYGGRRRMSMRNPMRTLPYMGGADLLTLGWEGPERPYSSWKNCAENNWKNRKEVCKLYKKPKTSRYVRATDADFSGDRFKRMATVRSFRGNRKTPVVARNKRASCNYAGYSGWTLPNLKIAAKSVGLRGFSKMKKAQLCQALNALQ